MGNDASRRGLATCKTRAQRDMCMTNIENEVMATRYDEQERSEGIRASDCIRKNSNT